MFTAPKTPQRPTTTPTQPAAPGAPLREIPPFHHHPAISTATATAVSTASTAPCTPPRSSRPPLPALTAPPNQKTLNSLGKMRYRWNDPNLAARYRAAEKRDVGAGAGAGMADYAYPRLQMASEPARGVVRRRRRGLGLGLGLGL